jgi:predicted dehydrogenase
MVGFNRRFAPLVEKMRVLLAGVREPKSFVVTVNAGAVPADHWTQDPAVGGGRIVGEACHFIDLLRFLAASPIADARLVGAAARNGGGPVDSVTLALAFEDGSLGTIHYLANGHRSFPKERVEAFCAGRVLQLDNFRRLSGYGWPRFARSSSWRQDKGQSECARRTVEAMRGNASAPIPFAEIVETSRAAIVLGEAARR